MIALAAPNPTPALAATATAPDVVVYADPTVAPAMADLGRDFRARTGVPVRVFPMTSDGAVSLVRQGARNDVLAIAATVADAARGRDLARSPVLTVHDPLVLAVPAGVATTVAEAVRADRAVATVDPLSADRLDGATLAGRLGFTHVAGQPNGPDAAAAVVRGTARVALIERADARRAGLQEVGVIADAPVRAYAIAVGRNAITPELDRFVAYLASPGAAVLLHADGWETAP